MFTLALVLFIPFAATLIAKLAALSTPVAVTIGLSVLLLEIAGAWWMHNNPERTARGLAVAWRLLSVATLASVGGFLLLSAHYWLAGASDSRVVLAAGGALLLLVTYHKVKGLHRLFVMGRAPQ